MVILMLCSGAGERTPHGRLQSVELNDLMAAMDRAAANLAKLEEVWRRAEPFIPTAPARGSDPEYDDLRRTWDDLLTGLPKVDGWTITDGLPDIDALGQSRESGVDDRGQLLEPPSGSSAACSVQAVAVLSQVDTGFLPYLERCEGRLTYVQKVDEVLEQRARRWWCSTVSSPREAVERPTHTRVMTSMRCRCCGEWRIDPPVLDSHLRYRVRLGRYLVDKNAYAKTPQEVSALLARAGGPELADFDECDSS